MPANEPLRFVAATDTGRSRDHNEDNFLVDKKLSLFVVADGMGGHAAGEVASAIAVRALHEEVRKERELLERFTLPTSERPAPSAKELLAVLEAAVQQACLRIHSEAAGDKHKRGMGTTLSALLVARDKGFIVHVGDSRIYVLRNGEVQQLTEDHTVHNEYVRAGRLSPEQAARIANKNAITRAVGVYPRVQVDTLTFDVLPGDVFLLCSDGLHGYIDNTDTLRRLLGETPENARAQALIDFANKSGGRDNITAVVVAVSDDEAARQRARRVEAKRELLSKLPMFRELGSFELLRIMQAAELREFASGEVIMREGEPGDELFVVLSGEVSIVKGNTTVALVGRGEHVGEMALIRSAPRSATVVTTCASELVAIHRNDFSEILQREPGIAIKVLRQFLLVLADRLDQTSQNLRQAREIVPQPTPMTSGTTQTYGDP